jgi:hypothetical protein
MLNKTSVAVKEIPKKNIEFFQSVSDEITLLQESLRLRKLLNTARELLHLGASNKLLTEKEENDLTQKISLLVHNPLTELQTLTPREFAALKPALVMTYITLTKYPTILRLLTTQRKPTKKASPYQYEIDFLHLAEPALKYGSANCDGHAAVALYCLLRSDWGKASNKSICICCVDRKHRFITVNNGESDHNPMVIDAYYDFICPLSVAVAFWKTKGYENGNVVFQTKINNIKAFLQTSQAKEILERLDVAKNSREAGAMELDMLAKRFTVEATKKTGLTK